MWNFLQISVQIRVEIHYCEEHNIKENKFCNADQVCGFLESNAVLYEYLL